MNYDERIKNLTDQINAASREVIIQDRVLGQHRERVAEIQGKINMLVELQQESLKIDPNGEVGAGTKKPEPTTPGRGEQPKIDRRKYPNHVRKKPRSKPGPKPKPEKKRARFKYPDGLRNFCIKNIDRMKNQELVEEANKEFDLDMDYNRLASYLKYNNIKRSKSKSREKDLPTLPPEDY